MSDKNVKKCINTGHNTYIQYEGKCPTCKSDKKDPLYLFAYIRDEVDDK